MIKTAFALIQGLKYFRRRVSELDANGLDPSDYRRLSHETILILRKVMEGRIRPEDVKPMLDALDKAVQSGTMDGGPGSGNHGHRGNPGHRGGSLPKVAAGTISKAIQDGQISTKLDRAKQSKHHKGSKRYNAAVASGSKVSFFSIDDDEIQGIIRNKAGTGTGYGKNGQYKETVDTGKIIAVHASRKGVESLTSRITIHYSKNGCHAVPASPNKSRK